MRDLTQWARSRVPETFQPRRDLYTNRDAYREIHPGRSCKRFYSTYEVEEYPSPEFITLTPLPYIEYRAEDELPDNDAPPALPPAQADAPAGSPPEPSTSHRHNRQFNNDDDDPWAGP